MLSTLVFNSVQRKISKLFIVEYSSIRFKICSSHCTYSCPRQCSCKSSVSLALCWKTFRIGLVWGIGFLASFSKKKIITTFQLIHYYYKHGSLQTKLFDKKLRSKPTNELIRTYKVIKTLIKKSYCLLNLNARLGSNLLRL